MGQVLRAVAARCTTKTSSSPGSTDVEPYVDNYQAVLIELSVVDRGELPDLRGDAWAAAAPAVVVDGFDG